MAKKKQVYEVPGFSLIEVLVACAIASMLALGIATLVNNMNKGVVSVQRKEEFIELKDLIRKSSQTDYNCISMLDQVPWGAQSGLAVKVLSSKTLDSINLPWNGGKKIEVKKTYGSGLVITKIEIQTLGKNMGGTSYSSNLHIEATRSDLSKKNSALPGVQTMLADVPLVLIDNNNDGRADSCASTPFFDGGPAPELVVAPTGAADCVGSTGEVIQECLNKIKDGGVPRTLLIRAGIYSGVSGLDVPTNATIRGDSGATVLLSGVTSSHSGVFTISEKNTDGVYNQVTIKDLVLDLSASGYTDASGIYVNGVNGLLVENVKFLTNSQASGQEQKGVTIAANNNKNVIIRNNIYGDSQNGNQYFYGTPIHLASSATVKNILIENNVMSFERSSLNLGAAVVVDSKTSELTIRGNKISTAKIKSPKGTPFGLLFTQVAATPQPGDFIINQNTFSLDLSGNAAPQTAAIAFMAGVNSTFYGNIDGNVINVSNGKNAIYMGKESFFGGSISSNAISSVTGNGISLHSAGLNTVVINSNVLLGAAAETSNVGIYFENFYNLKITNNMISNYSKTIVAAPSSEKVYLLSIRGNTLVTYGNGKNNLEMSGNSFWYAEIAANIFGCSGEKCTAATPAIMITKGAHYKMRIQDNTWSRYSTGISGDNATFDGSYVIGNI